MQKENILHKNKYFSAKRFLYMARVDIWNHSNSFLTAGLIAGGLYFLIGFFKGFAAGKVTEPLSFLIISLILGLFFTSSIFAGLHKSDENVSYLLIPASTEEKYLSKLLLTTLFYFIYSIAIITIVSLLVSISNWIFFRGEFVVFNPFENGILKILWAYVYFTSIYFFGSLIFKKYYFIKTSLSILGILILLGIISAVVTRIFFFNLLTAGFPLKAKWLFYDNMHIKKFFYPGDLHRSLKFFYTAGKVIFMYLVPVFLYVFSYLRLRKIEVRN